MSILQRPITDLKGVGQQLATRLANLQIHTLQDMLFHLPNKYVDKTRIYPIGTLRVDDRVVVEGLVQKVSVIPKPRRNLMVSIADSSGYLTLRFFHFNLQQQAQFKPGNLVRCFGQVKNWRNGWQMVHPEYKLITPDVIVPVEDHLTPIYPACDGVSQSLLRKLVAQALEILEPIGTSLEVLPAVIREEFDYIGLYAALQMLHFPTPDLNVEIVQRRLAFEELLTHHIILRQKRLQMAKEYAHPINPPGANLQTMIANLPFALTSAQQRNIESIKQDLTKESPMLRLVQGDVGSGKTLVALAAALQVIEAGYQVALMVPTEILAEQHFANLEKLCAPLNINVALLTGKFTNKQKIDICDKISQHQINLVIGTHALFQDKVEFANLALVIIDEQHRFGVGQRLALRNKGVKPHQLILTATPIPRTLAMTFYADLDYSVIDELPPGRKPINTIVVSSNKRNEILARIENICAQDQQVYWVCTLIEESEVLDCTPAEHAWEELSNALPNIKVSLVHGRMRPAEKDQIMRDFKDRKIDLLVATTVIEVGVDVPNASLMVIENPERLGLAQLHQLRGRVGRGNAQSYCVLMYKSPLSGRAAQRLQFMRDSQDGFAIAEFDLSIRGPGEVFGTKQSGLAQMRIADLVRDKDLLPKVIAAAEIILRDYPEVIPKLLRRWVREQLQYAVV